MSFVWRFEGSTGLQKPGLLLRTIYDQCPTLGREQPFPSSRYVVEPTREIRRYCRQKEFPASQWASTESSSAFSGSVAPISASDRTRPSNFCDVVTPRRCKIVGARSTLPLGNWSVISRRKSGPAA